LRTTHSVRNSWLVGVCSLRPFLGPSSRGCCINFVYRLPRYSPTTKRLSKDAKISGQSYVFIFLFFTSLESTAPSCVLWACSGSWRRSFSAVCGSEPCPRSFILRFTRAAELVRCFKILLWRQYTILRISLSHHFEPPPCCDIPSFSEKDAVWSTLPVFYVFMQFLLAGSYLTADWTKIGKEINDSARKSIAMTDATVLAAAHAVSEATETSKLLGGEPN
jgi:hypothetical protein